MTREEAIAIIKNYDANGCGYCHQGGNEVEEAFDMAIKALEQEIVLDKIRAEIEDIPETRSMTDGINTYGRMNRSAQECKADVLEIIDKYRKVEE